MVHCFYFNQQYTIYSALLVKIKTDETSYVIKCITEISSKPSLDYSYRYYIYQRDCICKNLPDNSLIAEACRSNV
jgi:hypothetical protein